jgi:hypothetical protein
MGNPDGEGTELINGVVYQGWGWPVIRPRISDHPVALRAGQYSVSS